MWHGHIRMAPPQANNRCSVMHEQEARHAATASGCAASVSCSADGVTSVPGRGLPHVVSYLHAVISAVIAGALFRSRQTWGQSACFLMWSVHARWFFSPVGRGVDARV